MFRPGAFPDNSATGDWHAVAHYTQIVWPTTTEVGCALASSATTDYFVCRYAPTGNKDGFYLAANRGDPLAPSCRPDPASRGRQLVSERLGPVADGVLLGRVDLAEGPVMAGRRRTSGRSRSPFRRAAARRASRTPCPRSFRICPCRARRSTARRTKWASWPASSPPASTSRQTRSIARPKSRLPILVLGPASGEDAGQPVQRIDGEAAVVGQRGKAGQVGRLARLQARHCRRRCCRSPRAREGRARPRRRTRSVRARAARGFRAACRHCGSR